MVGKLLLLVKDKVKVSNSFGSGTLREDYVKEVVVGHMIKNHFTATGIVFNTKNDILMINHKKQRVWLPPGGHIEENELPDDAVVREVLEETGVKARIVSSRRGLAVAKENCRELERPFAVLLEDIEKDGTHNHIDLVYLCQALNEDLTLQDAEVNGIGWFSLEQIKGLNTYENVIETVAQALDLMTDCG